MNIEISGKALAVATDCPRNFSCITDEQNNLCPVDECTAGDVLFIKCLYDEFCPYRETFANGFICTCPVRKEIYDKYGV